MMLMGVAAVGGALRAGRRRANGGRATGKANVSVSYG